MSRVLIVDDEIMIRKTLSILFKNENLDIVQARNVDDALQKLKNTIFNLVILDLALPPLGQEAGFKILQKKRKMKLNQLTPVIIITGNMLRKDVEEKLHVDDEVVEVLIKPIDNDTMMNVVRFGLERKTS